MQFQKLLKNVVKGKLTRAAQKHLLTFVSIIYAFMLPLVYALIEGSPSSIMMALAPIAAVPLNQLITKDRGTLITQVVSMTTFAWVPYLVDTLPGLKYVIILLGALATVTVAHLSKKYFKSNAIGVLVGALIGSGIYWLVSRFVVVEHNTTKEDADKAKEDVESYWMYIVISIVALIVGGLSSWFIIKWMNKKDSEVNVFSEMPKTTQRAPLFTKESKVKQFNKVIETIAKEQGIKDVGAAPLDFLKVHCHDQFYRLTDDLIARDDFIISEWKDPITKCLKGIKIAQPSLTNSNNNSNVFTTPLSSPRTNSNTNSNIFRTPPSSPRKV